MDQVGSNWLRSGPDFFVAQWVGFGPVMRVTSTKFYQISVSLAQSNQV